VRQYGFSSCSPRSTQQSGALSIHAYDQRETLLGQGTVGLEMEEQRPGIDTLLVAVGGGGLIAGIAAWFGGKVRVVGVEPEASPTLTMALSMLENRLMHLLAGSRRILLRLAVSGRSCTLSRRGAWTAWSSSPTTRSSVLNWFYRRP